MTLLQLRVMQVHDKVGEARGFMWRSEGVQGWAFLYSKVLSSGLSIQSEPHSALHCQECRRCCSALRLQVKRLHGKEGEAWGFIRPCDRAQDLFFHSSALAPGLAMADLKPGDDVEFCVMRDPTPEQPKRIVATRCCADAGHFSCCTVSDEWGSQKACAGADAATPEPAMVAQARCARSSKRAAGRHHYQQDRRRQGWHVR